MEKYCDRTFEAGTLTRDQFISWMKIDAIAAKMVFEALENTRVRKHWRETKIAMEERFRKQYSTRFKRQTTIDKYVAKELENWVNRNEKAYKYVRPMNSIAWSIRPWENGGCYHVTIQNSMDEDLGRLYDGSINNKYFLGCTGWYIGDDQYVHLHLSDELEAEWKADEKKLSDSIARFYAGTTYWGD